MNSLTRISVPSVSESLSSIVSNYSSCLPTSVSWEALIFKSSSRLHFPYHANPTWRSEIWAEDVPKDLAKLSGSRIISRLARYS